MNGFWIPERIWNLKELSVRERLFLSEVAGFTDSGRECFASNSYFAERLQCSEIMVCKIILTLIESQHIIREGRGNARKFCLGKILDQEEVSEEKQVSSQKKEKAIPKEKKKFPKGTHTNLEDRTKSKNLARKEKEVVMPFGQEEFPELWEAWKDYKREHFKFQYRSTQSEQVALHHLQKISNNDYETARQIIGLAIANGWKGLYPGPSAGKQGGNTPEWHKRFTGE